LEDSDCHAEGPHVADAVIGIGNFTRFFAAPFFGRRKNVVVLQCNALLEPWGLIRLSTA